MQVCDNLIILSLSKHQVAQVKKKTRENIKKVKELDILLFCVR